MAVDIYEFVTEISFVGYIAILMVGSAFLWLTWAFRSWLTRILGGFTVVIGAVGETNQILVFLGFLPSTLEASQRGGGSNATSHEGQPCLSITTPGNGAKVGPAEIVSGMSRLKGSPIWVVVQPLETDSLWVQGKTSADKQGRWSTTARFGAPLSEHRGKPFAVRAVAGPRTVLAKGIILSDWPEASCLSSIIRVTRN